MEARLETSSSIKNFISYLKCISNLSTSIVFQCTRDSLNVCAVASSMSACSYVKFPPQSFSRYLVTDQECLGYGRKISAPELIGFISYNGSWKDVASLTFTFTSTNIILTVLPVHAEASQKTVKLFFEQCQYLVPRIPDLAALSCQIVTLPKPWLTAFEMLTALRTAQSIQDVRFDVMLKKGILVRTIGSSCSRTLIEEVELFSLSATNVKREGEMLSFMVNFKDFGAAFELAVSLASMVNIYFDKRSSVQSDEDTGPLILQVPSVSGIIAEFVISAILPEPDEPDTMALAEESTVMSGTSAKRKSRELDSDDDHVPESDLSPLEADDDDIFEIPGTPRK